MTQNRSHSNRRSIRLPGYDYTHTGAYFFTIRTAQGRCLFSEVVDERVALTEIGRIARACWEDIPNHFPRIELDQSVVMPNHMHGIVWIVEQQGSLSSDEDLVAPPVSSRDGRRPKGPASGSIGAMVGSFKSSVSRQVNQRRGTRGSSLWQRNCWERVIRNEEELRDLREYIIANPERWEYDRLNPTYERRT